MFFKALRVKVSRVFFGLPCRTRTVAYALKNEFALALKLFFSDVIQRKYHFRGLLPMDRNPFSMDNWPALFR